MARKSGPSSLDAFGCGSALTVPQLRSTEITSPGWPAFAGHDNRDFDALYLRHHRPAECRQVHAVQQAGGPQAGAGARHAGRDARPPRGRRLARRAVLPRHRHRRLRGRAARDAVRPHDGAGPGRHRRRRRDPLRHRRQVRPHRRRRDHRPGAAPVGQAGDPGRQQMREPRQRRRLQRGLRARLRRAGRGLRRAHARLRRAGRGDRAIRRARAA